MQRTLYIWSILVAIVISGCYCSAHGQAIPTARKTAEIQVGGGFTFAKPDYGNRMLKGYSVYVAAMVNNRFGLEGDIHQATVVTPEDIGESTYLLGPRVNIVHPYRLNIYAKALGGFGRFHYNQGYYRTNSTFTYFTWAIGGGADVRLSPHWTVRAIDVEKQFWPSYGRNGLSPLVTTIGAAYTF